MNRNAEKKQAVVDVVQLLESAEIIDFNGHVSVRTGSNSFLINSGSSVRSNITLDDIVEVDLDGTLLDGVAVPPMEFRIHAEIYRRRDDVSCVAHTHPLWSTLLTSVGKPLKKITMQSSMLQEIRYFEKTASINTQTLGQELAACLDDGRIALLRSHGAVVAAENPKQVFALAVYLEDNARRQYLAEQLGGATELSPEQLIRIEKNLWKPNLLDKVWNFHYAKKHRDVGAVVSAG
jgi:ribulose-5-phosphate 4-epimerase/fuculose-1-phosphate aldolase